MSAYRCERCGWYILPGSETELVHRNRCLPKAEPEPPPASESRWRKRLREKYGGTTGEPPKAKRGPSLRQRCLEALRARLADRQSLIRLMVRARLKIHPEQLERVAAGRSDFAPTTWKRLAPFLDLD